MVMKVISHQCWGLKDVCTPPRGHSQTLAQAWVPQGNIAHFEAQAKGCDVLRATVWVICVFE